jgi:hypothetical protein
MTKQTANTLLMIEPVAFGFNPQTADDNYFQQSAHAPQASIQENALREFNQMIEILKNKDVALIVVKDTLEPHTPDSIFPNNWISFHSDGSVVLYPMLAPNRRRERRLDILKRVEKEGFIICRTKDYSPLEKEGIFLEGTGSMALDRVNRTAYAALSQRTSGTLFRTFCNDFGYTPVCFSACQTTGNRRLPVYHTNVMMCIGNSYAVVCLDAVDSEAERRALAGSLTDNRKTVIPISEAQMHCFAGNMLQIENRKGEKFLVMSDTAFRSLTETQINRLSAYNEIIRIAVPTIEKQGGGSVRCMMAEVFLPNS